MSVQEEIRRLDAQGVPARQIARDLGVSRDSVAKYVEVVDYSPKPVVVHRRPGASVLAELFPVIEGWLVDDARRPRKQRHTARRVFDRLVAEHGYTGSYSPVQRYIKTYKQQRRSAGDGYAELVWAPGAAQVDFGQAQALIGGVMHTLHVLVVTFPYSNMRFAQAYHGETAECVCHGLRALFEHIGCAPRQLIFDNATGIGRRVGDQVTESRLFSTFKLHYRCTARYCNPYSGNEKGNVENAVGFLRRNLMVPEPEAASIAGLNQVLLARCDGLAVKEHWRKHVPIGDLFADDVAACLALPSAGFDPVRYESRVADKTGTLLIDGTPYTAGPAFAGRRVTVGIRHDRIELLDEHANPIVSLPRVFGQGHASVFDPASLLPLLVRKPGAWGNSPVRAKVTDPVRDWLDHAAAKDRRDMLAGLDAATGCAGFEHAVTAADTLIRRGDTPGTDAIGMLARRLAAGTEPVTGTVNLRVYDGLACTTTTDSPMDIDAEGQTA
ncbi:IS21 family transposase [Leekyejoonella antrihumi]|uniref:IS21 family transposase n=1 Tax=Leekyejoonella antrihumi TaxID=1660198 RepID=A0A563DNW6_9MICO|nr:IS21 family transposase [Leekyejoonella antrihumi]TWP31978.1 IS21 family transposase [Leekyejoonella antrihumi]